MTNDEFVRLRVFRHPGFDPFPPFPIPPGRVRSYFRASGVTVTSTRWPSRRTVTFTGVPIFTASSA